MNDIHSMDILLMRIYQDASKALRMAHGYEELHAFRLSLEEISSQAFHARKKAKAMIRLTGGDNSLE